MPYIGNQHIVGDHINNFKVLDDISSYTETFNGASTNVVSTSDDTIRIPEHRFIHGQRVTYTNGGGGNIGGLTSGQIYFITFHTKNTIKLATNLQNANNNVVVNFSSVGSGTSHTINAAFDGVNTKFKITYEGGKEGRFNNATQLNIAINNVIQRPNLNPITFTEGFAIEDHHKIIFKVAPTVNDIFWGSIIANTIENFDLRDNEVDNFTGDGSATEFTLSTIPANNESVIVTIDGVLQHPSDKNVSRAYTLIDSVIQFTAAPALNAEIQVRHIGFAGASTADVSGFYGRTGNVTLTANDHITTGDITSRNINASGIVTASTFDGAFTGNVVGTSATFTGNLTVGGVLTYEDVTNVDSVGIITAQKDIHVGAGVSAVGVGTFGGLVSSDLTVEKSGNLSVNIKSTGGYGALEVGGTSSGYVDIKKPFSADFDLRLMHDGNNSYITSADKPLHFDAYSYKGINIGALGQTDLRYAGNVKLKTETGGVSVTGILTATSLDVSTDLDVDGHTNLDNVSIAGVTTTGGNLIVGGAVSSAGLNLPYYGSPDLTFGHGGSFGELDCITGMLRIKSGQIKLSNRFGNVDMLTCNSFGSVDLFHNGFLRFTTTGYGVSTTGLEVVGVSTFTGAIDANGDLDVDGHTNLDNVNVAGVSTHSDHIHLLDNKRLRLGTAANGDAVLLHNGSDTILDNQTGNLFFRSASTHLQSLSGEDKIVAEADGAVSLYHNNTLRLTTFDNNPFVGVSVTNDLILNGAGDTAIRWAVGGTAVGNFKWGIYHANADGHLRLFDNVNSRTLMVWKNTGAIELNYAASKKLETTSSGISVTGSTAVSGDLDVSADIRHIGDTDTRLRFETDTISARTAGSERLRINSSGKVIVGNNGTTFGNAAVQAFIQHGNTAGESGFSSVDTTSVAAGVGGEIAFHGKYNTGAQDYAYLGHIRGIKENATAGNTACALTFHTRPNATAPIERLRIDSSGRLQLGSSTLTSYNQFNGPGRLNIQNNSADGTVDFSQGIVFTDNVNNNGTWTHAGIVATGNSGYNGNLVFGTDGDDTRNNSASNITERMRIESSGDIIFKNNGGDNRIERNTTSGGPYLLFHNRGTNTTDSSGVYNLGGISAAGYRDVANPGIVGSMQFVRQPTAGGASSGCDIIFRTGFNGTTSHTGVSERMRISYTGAISSAVTRQALSYTALATPTYWTLNATGTSNQTIDVSSVFGVPDNAKAILVQGWYHVTGYSQGGAGQGDHASSHFSEYLPSGGAPWSFTTSSTTTWGQYVMDHDGDSSGSPHYYGVWTGQGIVNVNPNGNIYGRCFWGYSGGTHYNQLWCFGYYM